MFDAFRKTWIQEGIRAFYKGFGAVAAMTMPAHALYFGGYEATKSLLQPSRSSQDKGAWVHFTAGFVADVCGSIIWAPMDVIKQRVQMAKGLKPGFENSFRAFKTILRTDGPIGLYRGAVVAIATFGPYVGLYFSFYEQLKHQFALYSATENMKMSDMRSRKVNGMTEMASNLTAAFTAASLAALITCPIDVVKTNMQVYSVSDGGSATTLDAIRSLYKSGGLKVFMRGWNARVLWLAPGSAITMVAYEQCKLALSYITGTPELVTEEERIDQ